MQNNGSITTDHKRVSKLRQFLIGLVDRQGAECVHWPFGVDQKGYPQQVAFNGRNISAHRVMCILAHGEPPVPGLHAAHSCDNKTCVNPNHLRWATPSENEGDKAERGNMRRGETSHFAKLTTEDVLAIRRDQRPYSQIAAAFGVQKSAVTKIKNGRRWAHIR